MKQGFGECTYRGKPMSKKHVFLVVIIGLLLSLNIAALYTPSCSAGEVYWTDDFTDGSYYPEWGVIMGTWAAGVGILRSTDSVGSPHQAIIYRNSTASYGTWSFDLRYNDAGWGWVAFMHNSPCFNVVDANIQGYYIYLNTTHIALYLSTDTTNTILDSTTFSATAGSHPMQITRIADGTIEVRWESTLYLTATDTTYTTSTRFTLGSAPHGYGIDNIVVNGNDGITAPPLIPGFPAAATILGILIATGFTVLHRRRSKPRN